MERLERGIIGIQVELVIDVSYWRKNEIISGK
jgi:hypothetical protein